MLLSYLFLKAYRLRATLLLAQFLNALSFLLCFFLSDFPYILLLATALQSMLFTLTSLIPFYFALKWFRTELRFFVTSLLMFGCNLFPSQVLILSLTQSQDNTTINKDLYEEAMFIKGIVSVLFFGVLLAFYRDTSHLPNAMSARELDSIKQGLRLSFSSYKLILIVLSNIVSLICLTLIFRANQTHFEPYFTFLSTLLSFILFLPSFSRLRLRVSLSYKVTLLISTLLNVVLLLWASFVPLLLVPAYAVRFLLNYIVV